MEWGREVHLLVSYLSEEKTSASLWTYSLLFSLRFKGKFQSSPSWQIYTSYQGLPRMVLKTVLKLPFKAIFLISKEKLFWSRLFTLIPNTAHEDSVYNFVKSHKQIKNITLTSPLGNFRCLWYRNLLRATLVEDWNKSFFDLHLRVFEKFLRTLSLPLDFFFSIKQSKL